MNPHDAQSTQHYRKTVIFFRYLQNRQVQLLTQTTTATPPASPQPTKIEPESVQQRHHHPQSVTCVTFARSVSQDMTPFLIIHKHRSLVSQPHGTAGVPLQRSALHTAAHPPPADASIPLRIPLSKHTPLIPVPSTSSRPRAALLFSEVQIAAKPFVRYFVDL
jgi:hypothetical protein